MSFITLHPPLAHIEQRLFGWPDALLLRLAADDPEIPEDLRQQAAADPDATERVNTLKRARADWPDGPPTTLPSAIQALIDMKVRAARADFAPPLNTLKRARADWPDGPPVAPPPAIQALIDMKVRAARANFAPPPLAGQLLRLDTVPCPHGLAGQFEPPTPAFVLLDGSDDGAIWQGWAVSPDAAYAGFWDFVFQDEDGPVDPACAMAQIWNPVKLWFRDGAPGRVVGQLSPARLDAVRALALEFAIGEPQLPPPAPGIVALRPVDTGEHCAVTGSPLGGDEDPRHAYQHLYHHWAALLNEPAWAWQLESESNTSLLDDLMAVVAAAWRKYTGHLPQPQPQVAYAMGDEAQGDAQLLELQDDLQLTFVQVGDQFEVRLRYSGQPPLTVTLFADGGLAQREVLQAGAKPFEYAAGLDFFADNRLRLQWADGRGVELALTTSPSPT